MTNTKDLHIIACCAVVSAWWKFAKHFPILKNHSLPTIKLNNRLKTTAGRAWYDTNHIDISTELMIEHRDYIVNNTIPHEVGHLVANIVCGDMGHGRDWKHIMKVAGFENNRCHPLVNTKHEARKAKAI